MIYFKRLLKFPCNIILLTLGIISIYLIWFDALIFLFEFVTMFVRGIVGYLSDPVVFIGVLVVLFCLIVRLSGVKSLNSLLTIIKDNSRVLISACLLISLGIVFLLLEHQTVEPQDVYLHFDPKDNMISGNFYIDVFSISDFYNLIGSSFVLTGIFSVLLGFTDFVNYVSNRLRSIVITDEYIDKLSSKEKIKLRSSLDKAMYGVVASGDNNSLYGYLKNDLEVLFHEPYREDLHDSYYFKSIGSPKIFELVNRTTYDLVCTHTLTGKQFEIGHTGSTILLLSQEDQVIIQQIVVKIDGYTYYMGEVTANQIRSKDSFHLKLDSKCSWLDPEIAVFIDLRQVVGGELFSINLSIPFTITSELKRKIPIEIEVSKLTSAEDKNILLSMGYPTKGACLSCHMNGSQSSYRFCGFAYILNSERINQYYQENHYEMKINDWLFPGHGAVLTWEAL